MPPNIDKPESLAGIKSLAIVAMFSDDDLMERLVLKGGNLLDTVYGVSTRSSIDVDFSIDGEFEELDKYRGRIVDALKSTFGEEGYVVFDVAVTEVPANLTDDLRDFWGGHTVGFNLIERDRYDQFNRSIEPLRRNVTVPADHHSSFITHHFPSIGRRYGRIASSVLGPMPGTRLRSWWARKGPSFRRDSTIRRASVSPIAGSCTNSGQSAELMSTSNAATCGSALSISTIRPCNPPLRTHHPAVAAKPNKTSTATTAWSVRRRSQDG